jgi:aminoglycoside phosphotransferase
MEYDFESMFGKIVGHGAQATVYADSDFAVKLYREGYPKEDVFMEAYNMAYLERGGFPCPKIYEVLFVKGRYGLRMDRVKGRPVADIMTEALDNPDMVKKILGDLVDFQCYIHKTGDAGNWALDIKLRMRDLLARSKKLSDDLKQKLLEKLNELPNGTTLCHGDFHGDNVFFDGKDYMVIDLHPVSRGVPAADAASTFVSYCFADRILADIYLDLFCEKSGIHKKEILSWLPVYAGAILEYVPDHFTPILEEFIEGGKYQ